MVIIAYVNGKGSVQPVLLHSLAKAFAVYNMNVLQGVYRHKAKPIARLYRFTDWFESFLIAVFAHICA